MNRFRHRAAAVVSSHAFATLTLASLNVWICWRLFWVEYTPNFSSIEGAFIGIARYLSHHWSDFSWWPIWHCGMPYHDTYVPLVHLTAAALATVARISPAQAYHSVIGAAYALGPATLYLMAVRLGAARGSAFLAGLIYSLFSPCTLLLPEVAADVGGWMYSRRLQVLTVYGEGPHIAAMTLLPLVVLALEYAVRKRTGRSLGLAAVAMALIFLTNVPGTMATALAVFCWIAAQPAGSRLAAWRTAGAAALVGYGLACWGVPPSSLGTVLGNVGQMHSGFSASLKQLPFVLPLLLGAVAGAGYGLARARPAVPLVLRFAFLHLALTTALVLTARHSEQFELLPQVGREHLELEMSACLLLGALGWALYSLVPRWIRPVVLVLCLAPLGLQIQHYRWRARLDIQPVDPAQRSEYTSARWVDAHLGNERVYVSGSTGFWFNAFTDTPQLVGCCEQGESMPVLAGVPYIINTAVKPNETLISIAWLEALGAHAIVVNGPESTDEYRDVKAPQRFEGVLPLLHKEHGDAIYAVPQRSASMAHVIRPGEDVPVVPPVRLQHAWVQKLAAAIEDPTRPEATCQWLNGETARIRARLRRDDLILVQVAYFKGWKASVGGERRPVTADGLGLILIRPHCEGDCEVMLEWTGTWDRWLAPGMSLAALGVLVWLLRKRHFRIEKK